MHIVSVDDLTSDFIEELFCKTRFLRLARDDSNHVHSWASVGHTLPNLLMITDFYEPSTRTRLSFEAAMTYLGGHVIGTENAAEFSSAKKGESITDNFRVISAYCDVIVGRFKHEGEARMAAGVSTVPFINGGDGRGEHPTQALIDLFIIRDKLQDQKSLTITFMGDNDRSRTVRSLSKLLARDPNVTQNFLQSPKWMADPYWQLHHGFVEEVVSGKDDTTRSNRLIRPRLLNSMIEVKEIIAKTDIIYLTRDQVERATDRDNVQGRAKPFIFDQYYVNQLPEHALILHPLPRNSELPTKIDSDPRAHYFEQARNGLFIRMALLDLLLA